MKGGRYIYVGAILIALVASWIVSHPIKATANRSGLDSSRSTENWSAGLSRRNRGAR